MSTDPNEDESSSRHRAMRGSISLEDRLTNIEALCREILTKESATSGRVAGLETTVALLGAKTDLHDKILMGVCTLIGVTVITAIIVKVVH